MFFTSMRGAVRVILFAINGSARCGSREKLPKDQNYVLVVPHRTWWESLYLTVVGSPKKLSFMAKKELFKNPVLRFILKHVNTFPVDYEKPGPSAIKTPAKILRNSDLGLTMFLNGTRHFSELKGGVALIAKMGRVPIVSSIYQGPLILKELFKRKRVTARFGDSTDISGIKKMDKDGLAEVERRMQEASDQLGKEIDPTFKHDSTEKG